MFRVLIALFLVALIPIFAVANFRVEYLGIERGLSNNAITCIYQDNRGFMWFGTYDGLNRYDGYSFKVFRNIIGDTNSLIDNHIYSISGDRNQNLWIGAAKGLSVYNQAASVFATPKFTPWNSSTWEVMKEGVGIVEYAAAANLVLAGTHNKGLLVFTGGDLSGKQIPLLSTKEAPGSYTVTAIEIDRSNEQAWIFITRVGLCRYDFKTAKLNVVNATYRYADCIRLGRNGSLWLGNNDGLFEYHISSNNYSSNVMPGRNKVTSLFQDKHNTVWIGSDGGGLWHLPATAGKATPYLSEDGAELVNSNSIYSIYGDAEGRKWIGTLRGGVNIFHPRVTSFRTISYNLPGQNNSINNFILSFGEDEKSNVWIGTDGAGLRYWNRKENTTTRYIYNSAGNNTISSNFITSILRDAQHDTWFSTWYGGINRLKKGSQKFERFVCFNPVTNAEEANTWLVYEDVQKRVWASTVNNGTLYIFNRGKNTFELFDEKIINVQCLAEDNNGNLWAGNYTSLIRIDAIHKKHTIYNLNYPVRSIHHDKRNNLWIGTEGAGLLLFDSKTGSFKQFTTASGLPNNTILRILEDDKGNLWMSTYNGLSKFNVQKNMFRNYLQSDGLQSNQFSFNAGMRLKSGEFLFGGIRGFNIFQPDSVYDRKEAPPVFLTGISVSNTPVQNQASLSATGSVKGLETLAVPFDKATLSLDFVALEYTSADKIQYAYKLQGWDKDWIFSNTVRTANYSRLQEGNYTFKIKTTNADGEWGNAVQLIKLTVLPPWYRTWWAYLLYGVTFAAAIYLYVLYNKRQERLRYEVKLAVLEKDKEKELTEKKISFFTHISHEFRTPLTLIINPLKELFQSRGKNVSEKEISMIYRNARRLLSLVDQLLLFRKVESVEQQMRIERFDIVEACNEVHLSFCQYAEAKNIRFVFETPGYPVDIFGDREKIEIILFNLLSNSFKYTKEGTITLRVINNENSVELMVTDTGSGIPADTGNKLFESFYRVENKGYASQTGFGVGLYVSNKLALAHHGKLSYTSQPGSGTEFRLELLKGKAHFGNQPISDEFASGETILQELVEEPINTAVSTHESNLTSSKSGVIEKLTSELPTMLIVDDNEDIRAYLKQIFTGSFNIFEADDGTGGYELVLAETPDIVISDVKMKHLGGIEFTQKIKENPAIAHVPVILLTASSSDSLKLQGITGGAEDYLTKPFEKELIVARVANILKGRNRLQQYFLNAVTLKPNTSIAGEHKDFIETCIAIVEKHLHNPDFTIKAFCREIGMSHPALYKKVKAVSGLTINVFVRYLRLRKAAELLVNTDKSIVDVAYVTGFNDIKYFREQFNKLFEMNPSEYKKRYRRVFKQSAG